MNETNQYKDLDGEKWEANDVQLEYINEFVELCKENGSEVVFVTAPIANVSMEFIKNYDVIHSFMAEFAESLGIKYLDFNIVNKEEKLLELNQFRDDAHLNDSGVKTVNKYYINWLRNNTETFGNNS